ncbi:MAG TPA: hypothetical protein VF950_09815 [Planctomycetota bacterium]
MNGTPLGLPRPIKVAIGFLAADALWVLLLLARIGPRLWEALDASILPAVPLIGFIAWFGVAAVSIFGLLKRERTGLTAAITLMAASAFLIGAPLAGETLRKGRLLLDPQSLVLLGGFACFFTPLVLLLAGRRAYLAPPGG